MTPNELAAATAVDYDPFAGAPLARLVPTTAAQREVWLASRLEPEASLAYNEAIALTLKGLLDVPALEWALQGVVDRHEALRATFAGDGEGMFVAEHATLPIAFHDVSLLAPFESDARIMAAYSRIVTTPFDLENGPLVRAELFRLGHDRHLLTIAAHHIVCDGWSFGVIVRDLAALYAQRTGKGEGPAAAGAFSNFALAEAAHAGSETAREDETYWLDRFAGPVPVLDLPTDRSRPRRRTFTSRREDRMLDAVEVAGIKRLGASHGASFYATLLTGFAILLRRIAGQDDVVIGIPTAGQAAEGLDNVVGHAVNVLPLRASIAGTATFASVLGNVRNDLLDAFDHQRYTLGSLLARLAIARDPSRLPLVAVLFNLDAQLDESTVTFPGLRFDLEAVPREYENFELFVNAVQVDGGLRLECQYNADLFDGATVQGWLDAYATLLREAAIDPAEQALSLPLVSDAVYRELAALQPAPTPFPELRLAHEYFEQQADRAPDRAAVRHADRALTYAALESRANRVANALRARGVGHGQLVGLSLGRGVDMVAAVLGVLKSGAGYVPLDPAFPADRLAFMAQDAALAALVVDDDAPLSFAFDADRVLALNSDEVARASFERPERNRRAATPDSVAYVIFTSGSTGRPKGVRVPHRAAGNFLTSMQRVPGIAPDDRLVAVTTLSFDIAFMELLLPLTSGAEIVVAGRDDVRDGGQLRRLIEESDATMMQATPAGWRLLVDAGWQGRPAFRAVSGGEPLPVDLAEALLDRCGEVWNGYGPTETTVYSTYWRVSDPREGIYIGRPIANTTVHILDERGNHCPLGVPGEIHIGGAGVTLGYLDRPELTAEKFVPDPWSEAPDSRMYRTGDRGRWLSNGLLEHLGRLDFQVKVRGYRIEPGEIESVLADVPTVARAVAMAREDRPGDVRLVAYVVGRDGAIPDEDSLRNALRARLPDYMVPQHILVLDAIPLLPNGKIDRKALPPPIAQSMSASGERIGPRNEDERRVAAAMETVLSLPDLDIRDDFFALGGHSLLAAQLTARLNREFGVTLSFRTLFDAPTVEQLAAAIRAQVATGTAPATAPIGHRDDAAQDHAPLSLMQRRLWALERMHPGRVTYNAPSAHRLRGALDEAAFDMAFQALIQRQPILRTSFHDTGKEIVQVVAPRLEYPLFPAEDLSHLPEDARETRLMQRLQELTDTPFDLGRAPLFSARMFRLSDTEHALFFMPHHIIWDGWSFDILYNELSALYRAFTAGQPSPLAPLPVTYGDFAEWHTQWLESPAFQTQLAFWRERLAQMGDVRALPTDHPRRPGMSGLGRTEWIRVSREETDAMHEVARQADATLNMTLLALYYAMLSSSAGQHELVVGTPVRGRNQTEVESVMGYFNNLLPLHVSVDPALSFLEFVRHVKRTAIEAFGHPDVPLEYLQRELRVGQGAGATLYQALFSFQDARQRVVDWAGLAHEQILLFQSGATEDLGLWFLEGHAGMVGGVTYNADLLRADTARMMRERYLGMMQAVVANPSIAVGSLTAATRAERERMRDWNAGAATGRLPEDLVSMVEAGAAAGAAVASDAVAVVDGSRETTYASLLRRATRMAVLLRERGAAPGQVVGLCVELGSDRIAGLLAIAMTGGTALLLDRADPTARLRDILADARMTVLIGDAALEATLDWPRACALWLDADHAELDGAIVDGFARTAMDPDTPAVAFYVPGPDGRARGAALSHRALAGTVEGLADALGIEAGKRISGDALASDPMSAIEPLLALAQGATWVVHDEHRLEHGAGTGLDLLAATPETWQALIDHGWNGDDRLVAVAKGGTPTPQLATRLAATTRALFTLFGDTMSAPVATCGRLHGDAGALHEGRPVASTELWILDDAGEPCPIGATGDVAVAGSTLAMAFGHRAIGERQPGDDRLQRTGYRGRWLADGQLHVLDRADRRLRRHGLDVEPSAIETLLLAQAGVVRALAVARTDANGLPRIDAYAVGAPGNPPDADGLRAALASWLPAWSMPAHLVMLDALPLLATGEIDTAALPTPTEPRHGGPAVETTEPRSESERLLASVWTELLGMTRVRTSDNFFDVGGHSLLAVDMAARVQKLTGVQLNLLDIANGTLGTLAAELAVAPPAPTAAPKRGLFSRLLGRG
ncbi:amino acid adenylation domain-containing protein [Luteibacter sp. UNC138MFCol5.1]|uniref:non-ribosomal peptide synthetase n=1 Tax=Luteibacter sp. UNC138MFCol5.1 TaxID=1502774 RepID=UPI0008BD06C9|nr:non-ribosomal peptide synthetase [Luteibacter sp. UNC138MFCol5.1]SEO95529.1 amino acid adenylation domain-containing protein [Luteibacter sp. UNC138MFCol5.1]